jgi:hypothetical protein
VINAERGKHWPPAVGGHVSAAARRLTAAVLPALVLVALGAESVAARGGGGNGGSGVPAGATPTEAQVMTSCSSQAGRNTPYRSCGLALSAACQDETSILCNNALAQAAAGGVSTRAIQLVNQALVQNTTRVGPTGAALPAGLGTDALLTAGSAAGATNGASGGAGAGNAGAGNAGTSANNTAAGYAREVAGGQVAGGQVAGGQVAGGQVQQSGQVTHSSPLARKLAAAGITFSPIPLPSGGSFRPFVFDSSTAILSGLMFLGPPGADAPSGQGQVAGGQVAGGQVKGGQVKGGQVKGGQVADANVVPLTAAGQAPPATPTATGPATSQAVPQLSPAAQSELGMLNSILGAAYGSNIAGWLSTVGAYDPGDGLDRRIVAAFQKAVAGQTGQGPQGGQAGQGPQGGQAGQGPQGGQVQAPQGGQVEGPQGGQVQGPQGGQVEDGLIIRKPQAPAGSPPTATASPDTGEITGRPCTVQAVNSGAC